jgi:hypothetical protein
MNEKEAIERATAEAFIDHYNDMHATSFQIIEHGDAPDIIARDKLGNRLQLEIVMTEDRVGDIKVMLGRSDVRSIESLKRHVELVRQGKAEPMQRASGLGGNVTESLKERLHVKMAKRYGPNTALVIRDTSGVDWDWDVMVGDLKASFGDQLNRSIVESGFLTGRRTGSFSSFELSQAKWSLTFGLRQIFGPARCARWPRPFSLHVMLRNEATQERDYCRPAARRRTCRSYRHCYSRP